MLPQAHSIHFRGARGPLACLTVYSKKEEGRGREESQAFACSLARLRSFMRAVKWPRQKSVITVNPPSPGQQHPAQGFAQTGCRYYWRQAFCGVSLARVLTQPPSFQLSFSLGPGPSRRSLYASIRLTYISASFFLDVQGPSKVTLGWDSSALQMGRILKMSEHSAPQDNGLIFCAEM